MAEPDATLVDQRSPARNQTPEVHEATLRGWPRAAVRGALMAIVLPFVDLRIENPSRVPRTGAFLLVANHLHNADPVFIQVALQRPVHFMAKQELFRVPILRSIIQLVGSFPVNRERPGRAAIRQAITLLKSGIPVGIFPEGTRSKTGALGPAFGGAGLIAVESGVTILPVAIIGTEALPGGSKRRPTWRLGRPLRYRIVVRFGVPESLSSSIITGPKSSTAATEEIMRRIETLLPPAYHSVTVPRSDAAPN